MFEIARAWLADPLGVGAIAPSSPALARALADEAVRGDPRVVVEVGAGSGAVTRALAEAVRPPARLVATRSGSEAAAGAAPVRTSGEDEQRRQALLVAMDINRDLLRRADAVRGAAVLADAGHPPVRQADVVVSGIPFGSLPESDARRVLAALADLAPRIVLFQYTERRLPLVREYYPGAEVVSVVWANIPPAQVVASPLA